MTAITLARVSYTILDAVAATGISETTIKAAIADGSLVANYVGAKASKPVLRAVELDAWIASMPTQRGAR